MLQIIKWESVKQFHRLKWPILGIAVVLLTLLLLPASWGKSGNFAFKFVLMLFSLVMVLGTFGLALYPMYNMIGDFRRKTYTMERITGKSHIAVFFSKIIMNLVMLLLAAGLVYAGTTLMDRFSTENIHFFVYTPNKPYLAIMLEIVLLYPAILLFCYMSSSILPFFRNHRTLGTLIGVAVISIIASFFHLSGTLYYVAGLIVGIILIIVAGRMADKHFEQHIYNW